MNRLPALALSLVLLAACGAIASGGTQHVVLVLASNLSIRDIADPGVPRMLDFVRGGSVALVNVRTGRPTKDIELVERPGMEAGCVTLGAGAMGIGGAEVRRAADAPGLINGVPAAVLYGCYTGRRAGRSEVLHTEIVKMQRINAAASYRARPGALGSALHEAGVKTAVVGCSDLPGEIHREAVAAAMDEAGLVDYGDVDAEGLVVADPGAPCGVRTDTNALLGRLDRALKRAQFVVVDFGDTFRADAICVSCTDEQMVRVRRGAVSRLADFLWQARGRLDPRRDLLILLSPASRTFSEIEDERLTPIVFAGRGFPGGALTSASTRRRGVVTLCDVAPTILDLLGAKTPIDMVGRPIRHVAFKRAIPALSQTSIDAAYDRQCQVVMQGASVVQSIVVILVTLAILLGAAGAVGKWAAWCALIPVALPTAMLYLPLFWSGGPAGAAAVLVALTAALLGVSAIAFRRPMRAFVWLAGALAASLAIDLLRGVPLMSSSIAGYSLVEGARFYGLGNELMGSMLGAVLMGTAAAMAGGAIPAKLTGPVAAAVFVAAFLFIGAPGLGADTGGALATVPAIAVALSASRGWRPTARGIALIALITALAIGALFALDAMRGGASESHAGRAARLAASGGMLDLLSIFQRKIALNFMLLSTSLWSRLLGLSLAGSAALFWWGRRKDAAGFLRTWEAAGALGCSFGVVGAFVFNDSGVLAAAACAVFLWMFLALRCMDDRC